MAFLALLLLALQAAPPQDAEAPLSSAREKADRKDWDGALADANRALELDPRSAAAWRLRGIIRANRSDLRGAVDDLTKAIGLGADSPVIHAQRGSLRAILREFEGALADLDQAVAGGIREAEVWSNRSLCRLELGHSRGAISDATRALELEPNRRPAFANRLSAYAAIQSWDNALRDHRRDVELAGRPTPNHAIRGWLLRARRDGPEAADKDLRDFLAGPSAPPPDSWKGIAIAFLLGDRPEEDLLKAPGGTAGEARYLAGCRRLAHGDAKGARPHLEDAAADARSVCRAFARAEIEFLEFERRKALVEELEKKFRALGPFRAEYLPKGDFSTEDPEALDRLAFDYDRARATAHARITMTSRKDGEKRTVHFLCDKGVLMAWGMDDKAYRMDGTSFFSAIDRVEEILFKELDRLLPGIRREASATENLLCLVLDPRMGPDRGGRFQFAMGRSRHPTSWLREARNALGSTTREEGDAVTFDMPSKGKTLTVDRATGLIRRLRIRDYDGTTREIELSSFSPLEKLPEERLPEKFQSQPLDHGQFISQWRQQQFWLVMMIEEILERREGLAKAGKEAEARAILTRWAAQYADSCHAFAIRSMARGAIRRELDRGIPLEELLRDAGAAARKFADDLAPQRGQIGAAFEARIRELAFDVETEAIERPIDSTLHGPLKELLRRSLDPAAVDAERLRSYGDRIEPLYREELDAHRGA